MPHFLRVPLEMIKAPDRHMIQILFFIGIVCTLAILDPFMSFSRAMNASILLAIPLPVGLLMLLLAPCAYYSLNIMERYYFVELEKKEVRREQLKLRQQNLCFVSRYRQKENATSWEITNRNIFNWTNAKVLIERNYNGQVDTEKIELGAIETMKRVSVNCKLASKSGSKWRVLILAKEGYFIDYPERQASLDYEL